jgi:hypothetical protein
MGWRNLFILVKLFGGVKAKNSHRLTLNSRTHAELAYPKLVSTAAH